MCAQTCKQHAKKAAGQPAGAAASNPDYTTCAAMLFGCPNLVQGLLSKQFCSAGDQPNTRPQFSFCKCYQDAQFAAAMQQSVQACRLETGCLCQIPVATQLNPPRTWGRPFKLLQRATKLFCSSHSIGLGTEALQNEDQREVGSGDDCQKGQKAPRVHCLLRQTILQHCLRAFRRSQLAGSVQQPVPSNHLI
jgi:hypothetical protein